MDITEEQMPPSSQMPIPDKGALPKDGPDTGAKPDLVIPIPEEEEEPVDPSPDMDPAAKDPVEGEAIM
jgi:hypothetical protein